MRFTRAQITSRALARLDVANLHTYNLCVEQAGVLHGRMVDDELVIDRATVSCKNEERTSVDLIINAEVGAPIGSSTLRVCWHLHPTGGTEPSDADEKTWRDCWRWHRAHGGSTPWLSLIVDGSTRGNVSVGAYATDDSGSVTAASRRPPARTPST